MSSTPGYAKRYELDRALGVDRSPVPASPVRDHVRRLREQGLTPSAIGRAAGISRTAVRDIAACRTTTVRRAVAARLLRVTIHGAMSAAEGLDEVPAVGTVRRVRALLALGHTHARIAEVAGVTISRRLTEDPAPRWVTRAGAEAIARAFDELSMTPGTSAHTRNRARKAGYVPPLAWDDESIDDPAASPTGVDRRAVAA